MERDLTSSVEPKRALNIQDIVSDTTTAGNIIDSKGFESVDISLLSGAVTDGTYTVTIVSGEAVDDEGTPTVITDAAAVDADFIIGTLPEISAANAIKHFGYVGKQRWFQISVVSTAVTTGGTLAAQATMGNAAKRPTS